MSKRNHGLAPNPKKIFILLITALIITIGAISIVTKKAEAVIEAPSYTLTSSVIGTGGSTNIKNVVLISEFGLSGTAFSLGLTLGQPVTFEKLAGKLDTDLWGGFWAHKHDKNPIILMPVITNGS